jgi:hypothetical protein
MLGLRVPTTGRARDDGEKPFWISFSDLMSALMVLFLVVMSVALLAVTKKISDEEREEKARSDDISSIMQEVAKAAGDFEGVRVIDRTIDFGPRGRFEKEGQNTLSSHQRSLLLEFTPRLLEKLRHPDAEKWFKRAVVEGYASQSGKYLFNLNLSLERSQRVICELLREVGQPGKLSAEDGRLIATRFFVGGASFNSLKNTADDSRRIELKLEFKTREEVKEPGSQPSALEDSSALASALDPRERCPIIDR